MKRIITFIALGIALTANAATKYFMADDETNFCNPERGFYTASEQDISKTTTTSNLTDGEFNATSGRSLVYRQYVFSGFREDSLSQTVLDLINTDFATYRRNGFKCVLRFSYTVNDNTPYQDGSPEIWKKHLEQLKPVMEKNADVIAVVQAGMLGVWGEWYYSSTGTGDAIPQQVRTDLIDQMLEAVPVCRAVQLRTPKYKTNYIGDKNPLTMEEAFSGSKRARLGHFNDAFLYEQDNMGTYTNRKKDMDYLDQECMYLPNGGETDVDKQNVYNNWATGEKAMADMAKVHFSFINQDYTQLVMSSWKKEGAFVEIAKHMGYRYQLVEADLPQVQRPNAALAVHFAIKNVGFASMYNERKAYVALMGADTTYLLPLESDPRLWAPNGAVTEIDEQLTLPTAIKEGNYSVALYLPDVFESIANDPRYAVRFANVDMWDSQTGYNQLDVQINVSSSAPEPQPEPEPTPSATVNPITDFSGTAGQSSANLSWTNPGAQIVSDTFVVNMTQVTDTAYNGEEGNSSATVSYVDGVVTTNYTTLATWLWAGARFPVGNITEMTSVSFECKGDGTNITLYPYAHDGTYRWMEDAFSVSLSNTKWERYTYTPQVPLWASASYEFLTQPVIDLGFIANPATASSGSFQLRNIQIENMHVQESDFAGVRVIRNDNDFPASYSDGTTVYYGTGEQCTDAGLEFGHTYYYAAYAVNKDGKISNPTTFSITIDGSGLYAVSAPQSNTINKVLYQGQLLILRDGSTYNVLGQPLR